MSAVGEYAGGYGFPLPNPVSMHPKKIFISTVVSGVDFLGWVHFPDHRVLRTVTKQRMFKAIKAKRGNEETVQSYLGLLRHGNS
jgi:hypothetical protein